MAEIKLHNDLFNICNRLKEIDNGYYIIFNNKKGKFFLKHSLEQGGVVIPYDRLDARTINWALQSRMTNIDFAKIDQENNLMQEKQDQEQSYQSRYRLQELLSYANNHGDVDFISADSTRWI